jgi:predicted nucleic acid-binding protein
VSAFIDTSAPLAVLDSNDKNHAHSTVTWESLMATAFAFDRHFAEQGFDTLP